MKKYYFLLLLLFSCPIIFGQYHDVPMSNTEINTALQRGIRSVDTNSVNELIDMKLDTMQTDTSIYTLKEIDTQIGMLWALHQPLDTTIIMDSFIDSIDAPLATLVESYPIGIGANDVSRVSTSIGEYRVKYDISGTLTWSPWTSTMGFYKGVDSAQGRHTSSASNSATTNQTLYISDASDIFSITTVAGGGAQVWYVDRDATGSANGTSWTNAWTSPADISWGSLSAGDTVYVSGGTDSTTYVPSTIYGINLAMAGASTPTYTYASGNPVVITPAYHDGHNGGVYFIIRDNANHRAIMRVGNVSNIKIRGFQFHDIRTDPEVPTMLIQLGNGDWGNIDSLIYFEDNFVQNAGQSGVMYLSGTKITLRNNYFNQLENSFPNDNDPIGISSGRGGHTIDRNIFIMRNDNDTTSAHRDGIQISNHGDNAAEPIHQITISNNFIIETREAGVSWNNLFYSYGGLGGGDNNLRLMIYNNILVGRKVNTSMGGIAVGRLNNTYPIQLYVLNNTMIIKGSGGTGSTPITCWQVDSVVIKNNLIVVDTLVNNILNLDPSGVGGTMYIDYNHYAEYGGTVGAFCSVPWATWLGMGYDANSNLGNSSEVTFTNKYDTTIAAYYTETGRDLGVDLSTEYPFLATDILGNLRSGSWDIGALEYQGSQSSNINLESRLFLQGPFGSNSMSTNITQNGLLPNSQPFNTSPWNYNGNEILNSGSTSNFVDWVLVELRNNSNPSEVVSRKAAILKNDGTLLNTDGSSGVPFNNVNEGSYYIAVFHRNHLALMSANPVQLSANSQLYDFTTDMNKAYGTNPMKDLGGGKFGMFAGDGNSNGGVTISDRNEVWAPQNGTVGYLKGDFDLDGGVTVNDVNLYWNINNGTMTQVP